MEQLQHLRHEHLLPTPGIKMPEYTTCATPPCPLPPYASPLPQPNPQPLGQALILLFQ